MRVKSTLGVGALSVMVAGSGPCSSDPPQIAPVGGWQQVGAGVFNTNAGSQVDTEENIHHQAGRVAQTAWVYDKHQGREILWVGTSHGGLWKPTVDASGNITQFSPLTDNFAGSHTLASFVVHPLDSDRILISTGTTWGDGDGIYATSDGGASWAATTLSVTPDRAWRLVDDRSDATGDTVLAATSSGIFRTTNFGTKWTRVRKDDEVSDIAQDTLDGAVWYAGVIGDGGVEYSNDGGVSWCPLGSNLPDSIKRISVATSGHFVYALVVGSDKAMAGIFRYDTTAGLNPCSATSTAGTTGTWEPIADIATINSAIDALAQASHTATIAADPEDPAHVLIGAQTIAETFDATGPAAQVTWETDPKVVDCGHHDLNHMLFLPGTHTIVFSNDGGYYLYDYDTGTIDDTGNLLGINALELSSKSKAGQGRLAVAYSDPAVFGAGLQDNGLFVADGADVETLLRISGGDGGSISFSPGDPTDVAFSTTILSHSFGGNRFVSFSSGLLDSNIDGDIGGDSRSTMLIDPIPNTALPFLFTHSDGTNKNTDGDPDDDNDVHPSEVFYRALTDTTSDWSRVGTGITLPDTITELDHTTNPALHEFAATAKNDYHLYVLTGPRSAIGSLVLVDRTPPLATIPTTPDARIAADKSELQPDTLYYTSGNATEQAAFASFDGGVTWKGVLGDLPTDLELYRLIANPANTDQLFLATSRGIWRSLDGGAHWADFSKGLRVNEVVDDVVINADHADPPRLYVATRGRGFYTRTLENHAPELQCAASVEEECAGATTKVKITTHIDDIDGDELEVTWQVDGVTEKSTTIAALAAPVDESFSFAYPKGTHVVTVTVDDGQTTTSCTTQVTIVDTTPPVVTCSLAETMLWAPAHDLVDVGLTATAIDRCDGRLPVGITVWSDEDDQTSAGGLFSPDAKGLAPGALRLRAERSGFGDGRVYLVTSTASDASGNVAAACCTAEVPHDESATSRAEVEAEAAAAAASCPMPPGGYSLIGDGPVVGPMQ